MLIEYSKAKQPGPVGTEFVIVIPPSNEEMMNFGFRAGASLTPSGDNFTVWRYRVTEYHKGAAVLEPINEKDNPRHVAPIKWAWRYGRLVPIPPAELLPLMDESWRGSESDLGPDGETKSDQAYHVIATLASEPECFYHEEVQRALDYFSDDGFDPNFLPFLRPSQIRGDS